jgi:geranylgeranyl reductase family protein
MLALGLACPAPSLRAAMQYDLLVIGAGPAGSAAARHAAQRGLSVALVDRAEFPRDKTCGDGLIADALAAIESLGLSSQVLAAATAVSGVRLYAPDSTLVPLRGECLCVPRRVLDNILREGAMAAGAEFAAPLKALTPIVDHSRVVGATFVNQQSGEELPIRAKLTLLATGAAAEPLTKFGVCRRSEASATAARVYVEVPPEAGRMVRQLVISFDASLLPGYGWIFPIGDSTFNLGVGLFYDAWRPAISRNVRVLLDVFIKSLPADINVMQHATSVSQLKGAPLRTAMAGATFARPGLLVIGEAAGLTYSLTGEGIGKAMESGILAAEIAATQLHASSPERVAAEYARELTRRYTRKFRGYKRAQDWMNSRRLANFLAKRANDGRFVRGQLEGMFADTVYPQRLLSPLGIARALVG